MRNRKEPMTNNKKLLIVLLVEVVVLVIMTVCFVSFYIDSKYKKLQHLDLNEAELGINEAANSDQDKYQIIALFGIDARDNTDLGVGNRSDSIMIASINKETKEVRIASIYRDTLLNVDYDGGFTTKVTHAYAYGGPELAVKTLNQNLDLKISEFVSVNFMALTKSIDTLGGVTINVEEDELPVLNSAIAEQVNVTGIFSDGVFTTGTLVLNGTQATAYSRIRSTDRGDITRTERQREVLTAMIKEAKSAKVSTIDDMIDAAFPYILTSLDKKELISFAKSVKDYELSETTGFPEYYVPVSHETKGAVLVADDLISNVSDLHAFLFGTENYVPSTTVQNINDIVGNETGVYTE